MLIKRVAWLKRMGPRVEKSLSRQGQGALVVCLMFMALAVSGLRGPAGNSSTAIAAEDDGKAQPAAAKNDGSVQIAEPKAANLIVGKVPVQAKRLRNFNYVPADAKLVAAVSPSELAKLPSVAKLFSAILDPEFERKHGFKLSDLADVQVIVRSDDAQHEPPLFVLTADQPLGWQKILAAEFSNLKTRAQSQQFLNGKEYYVISREEMNRNGDIGPCFYIADERTMVAGTEEEIKKVIQGNEPLMNSSQFPDFESDTIAVRAEMKLVKKILGVEHALKDSKVASEVAVVMPLLEHTELVRIRAGGVAGTMGNDTVGMSLLLECDSDAGADDVFKTLEALRTIGLNLVEAKVSAWRQATAPPVPQEQIVVMSDLFEVLKKGLHDARIAVEANHLVAAATDVEIGPPLVASVVMPAIEASREAAMRKQTMNSLREIALAMYQYNDVNKHFPPAAIRDKDGKPVLSWRVAILPFIEQKSLYDELHLDEPWDSEHNKALIAKMPAIYRDPHEDETSTNASYFMPTGNGMFGGDPRGMMVKNITDGSANTIMLVEAKRDIPWTKPEDFEIDADATKPLPKFGGHMADGLFAAGFADGHIEGISSSKVDAGRLHAMFTVGGGEDVSKMANPSAVGPSSSSDFFKQSEMRGQSLEHTNGVTVGLLQYKNAHKRFPPPAITDKNGKPLLSWRVAILPYLEEPGPALYNEFNFDEPWDSEHNRKLIGKMPDVFRDPHDDSKSTNASYFMPTGAGTVGDSAKGTSDADIADDPWRTILFVEAKRPVPWTKPEDIVIDPDHSKPLPKLGGYLYPEDTFAAEFVDGSGEIIGGLTPGEVDPRVLRSMFDIASGKPRGKLYFDKSMH